MDLTSKTWPLLRHRLALVPRGIFKPLMATGLISHLSQTVKGPRLVSTLLLLCSLFIDDTIDAIHLTDR